MPWINGEWEVCKDEDWERKQRDTPGTPEFNAELEIDKAWHKSDKAEARREDAEDIDTDECANCGRVERVGILIEATRRGFGLGEWYCAPNQGCCKEDEKPTSTFDTPKDALAAVLALSMQSLHDGTTEGGTS